VRYYLGYRGLELRQEKIGSGVSAVFVPVNEASRTIERAVVELVDWSNRLVLGDKAKAQKFAEGNPIIDMWHFRARDPRDK
jgi:hypothetical protein